MYSSIKGISVSDRERIRQLEEQARALGLSREQVESMKTAILSSKSTEQQMPSPHHEGGVPFGQYSLVERLGNGVLSKMYKALSPEGEEVVLKIMRPDFMKSPFLDRFSEISAKMVEFFHPNWIISHELIREPGLALVSEYLDGAPFSINDEPVPIDAVTFILREILTGLAYVHEKGEYHGNLKPTNVILCRDGAVKLLDYGMHKVLNSSKGQSSSLWYGTLSHMAPEIHQGEWGAKADVYSAGLLAWELLAGRPACPHQNIDAQRRWHASMGPMGIELVRKEVPSWLGSIITAMCQRDPNLRPADAMDVLDHWQEGYGVEASRPEEDIPLHLPSLSVSEKKESQERPRTKRRRERSRARKRQNISSSVEVEQKKPRKRTSRKEKISAKKERKQVESHVEPRVQKRVKKSGLLDQENFFTQIQTELQERLMSMNLPGGLVLKKKRAPLLLTEVISNKGFIGSLISLDIEFSAQAPKGYVLLSYDLLHNLFNRYTDGETALKKGTRKERISHTDRRSLERFLSPVFEFIQKTIPSSQVQNAKISVPDTQGKREVALYQIGTDSSMYGMLAVGIPTEFFSYGPIEGDVQPVGSEPDDVMSELMDVSVSVRSALPSFRLSYQSLQELSVGSVLPLPKNWNKNLRIIINDTVAFVGEYGVEEGSHAILIHSQYRKKN